MVPVVCNVAASGVSDPAQLRQNLVRQVTATVRWRESVQWMARNGVTQLVELGAGRVLTGLVRRIDKKLAARAINEPQDVEAFLVA